MRRLLAPVLAVGIFALAVPLLAERRPPADADAEANVTSRRSPSFSGLEPGDFVSHRQTIPVDIVLIGFDINQINRSDLAGLLPGTSKPAVRYPQFYGLNGRDVGLEYEFRYSLTRKNRQFEDRFFRFLAQAGTPGAPTVFMTQYNSQATNVLDVTGPVLYIDGPTVERWLENNANPRTNGYTVYFINWFGRQDFRFQMGCDCKGQSQIHSAGITFHRRIDELLHPGKRHDLVELPGYLRPLHPQDGPIEVHILSAGQFPVKACPYLQERAAPTI